MYMSEANLLSLGKIYSQTLTNTSKDFWRFLEDFPNISKLFLNIAETFVRFFNRKNLQTFPKILLTL